MSRGHRSAFSASLRVVVATCFAVVLGTLLPRVAHAQGVRVNTWAPNGPVYATARVNNVIYMGGEFTSMGLLANNCGAGARVEYATGNPLGPFDAIDGEVLAVEPDGAGGWYIGGSFASVQGQPRSNLAQIDFQGVVTSWNPSPNSAVYDIASFTNVGGPVYIVGGFSTVGGASRLSIAGINPDGTATAFNPTFDLPPTQIERGGIDFYVSGQFTFINGLQRPRVAAFNSTTGALSTLFLGQVSWTNVTALKWKSPSDVLFAAYQTATGYGLSAWRQTGFLPYSVTTNGPILDIDMDTGSYPGTTPVYIGGDFSLCQGVGRTRLAAFDTSTGVLAAWNPTADGLVRTIGVRGGFGLLVGGDFGALNGQSRRYLGAVDFATGATLSWDPRPSDIVRTVGVFGPTHAYVGGNFDFLGAVARSNLAAVDANSGALLDWNPTTNGRIDGLAAIGTDIYVGGRFSVMNGVTRNRAGAVDRQTGALTAFAPNVGGGATAVYGFANFGTTVYMCGAFSSVNGLTRVGVAAVDAALGSTLSWNANGNGAVYTVKLIIPDFVVPPTVFVGGQFTSMGGAVRNNLAAVDGATGVATAWNPSPDGWVQSLVVFSNQFGGISKVYVGGVFNTIGGHARTRIAEINSSGAATAWAPNANGGVSSIATFGTLVYLGGTFTSVGGQVRNGLAAIDNATGLATSWDPNVAPPNGVVSVLKYNSTIYAGGTFLRIAGVPMRYFAGVFDASVTNVETDEVSPIPMRQVFTAPNPFEERTTIRFALGTGGSTRVSIFDVSGALVRRLHDGWLPAGAHVLPWDGKDEGDRLVGSGIYFARVQSAAGSRSTKLYRLK